MKRLLAIAALLLAACATTPQARKTYPLHVPAQVPAAAATAAPAQNASERDDCER